MNTRLAVYKRAKLTLAFPVTNATTTIGRDEGNAIQLPDPEVSKQHAVIHAKDNSWTIEDLDSTNGFKVNGRRIKRASLKDGDRVRIGPFELVFHSSATSDLVPSNVIDLSSQMAHQTIVQPPESPPG